MSDIDKSNRAIGLVSIGNPITLITSLEKFKEVAPGYKIYVFLNVPREHITPERFEALTANAYKIINNYRSAFSEIFVVENTTNMWVTHGQCISMLLEVIKEESIAIFEEDAYMFSRDLFEEKFAQLKTNDLVCVVAPQNPNNFQVLFNKLSIFEGAVNMPGKESIFFVNKSINQKFNWYGFDYVKWLPETVYIRNEGTRLAFKEEIHFDTFEFFSFNCWMNKNIKVVTYNEESFDYWVPEGRGDTEGFFRNISSGRNYMHYFNGALFQYLDYLSPKNTAFYKRMVNTAGHYGQFMYHMSTYTIHLGMLLAIKSKYIDILGKEEFNLQRNSLKRSLQHLFVYFGIWKIKHQFKFFKYIKFTYKFMKKYHCIAQ